MSVWRGFFWVDDTVLNRLNNVRHSKLGHWLLDNEIVRHCLHLLLRVTLYGILLTFLIYGKSGKVCSPIPFQNRRFCHSFGNFR